MKKIYLIALFLAIVGQINAGFYAGVGRKVITPDTTIWLSGYASRTKPSSDVLHDIWAKALVIEENDNIQLIIVTIDVIGLSHNISETIAHRVIEKYGIDRSKLLLNTSHTHSAPVIWPSLSSMFEMSTGDQQTLIRYNSRLANDIADVIDVAVLDLKPAYLFIAHGSSDIAINRRQTTGTGVAIGVNKGRPRR
jgi:hypothetical protein